MNNVEAESGAGAAEDEAMSVDEDEAMPGIEQIQCICRILRRVPPNTARNEIDILKTLFTWPDEIWEKITNYR